MTKAVDRRGEYYHGAVLPIVVSAYLNKRFFVVCQFTDKQGKSYLEYIGKKKVLTIQTLGGRGHDIRYFSFDDDPRKLYPQRALTFFCDKTIALLYIRLYGGRYSVFQRKKKRYLRSLKQRELL